MRRARFPFHPLLRRCAPGVVALGSLAASFAGRPQLNEAPVAPAIAETRAPTTAETTDAVPSGFTIASSSREASRVFFRTVYASSEDVPIGWNGSVAGGNAGTTSATFKEAVQRRVNYFRAMAGIPAGIAFDLTYNTKDQQAALMMSANDNLSHTPPTNWTDYTPDGAEAAGNSNLFLGYYGPQAITGYIEDFGDNASAGHRRWILYPQTTTMGTGDIPPDGTFQSANALWVLGASGAPPVVRDTFVAWPPPGFVPYSLVFPRWSLAYVGANFASATVTMMRNGASVPVSIQTRGAGAGDNAIVWTWDNLDPGSPMAPGAPPANDTPVQVAVNGVVVGGQTKNFSYTVTLFDPQQAGADTVAAVASGPAQPTVGISNNYASNLVPNAVGYQFRTASLSAFTAVEGAENGTANVTVDAAAGATIISSAYHASGSKSFHFTTPAFDHQSITLNHTLLAAAGTQLKFKSRFGFASAQQVAHAQVSTDDGISWDTVFSAAGNDAAAAGFTDQTVSLAAYANRSLTVRFLFAYEGPGLAYTQTADNFGWYLDDISIATAQELTATALSPVSASPSFGFTPAAVASYALQARAEFFGDYLFEWGPVLTVAAVPPGPPHIDSNPADKNALAGDTVQFTVVASGPGTLSYQWFHGTQPINGATAATLTLSDVQPGDAGGYHVEVSNGSGTTPSNSATLTVTIPDPVATTNAGSALSETAVMLNGHVEVHGQTVTCGFESGSDASLGTDAGVVTASSPQDIAATISSIVGNAPVYFRAFAEVTGGARFYGAVKMIAPLQPVASLQVSVDPAGSGTVGGIPAGSVRVGDAISLTAQPASGQTFAGWTGGLTSASATLAFAMPASLTLVANFAPSPLTNAAGRYRGLALTSPAAHASCGLVTLTVAAKGGFSGKAVIGGAKFAFRGVFDAGGVAQFGASTEAALKGTSLLLRLHLPIGSGTPARVLGDVRDSVFTAAIDAPRAAFTAAKKPAAPLTPPPAGWPGPYTASLTLSAATPISALEGRGWLTATIGKDGGASFKGRLADGTHWSSRQPLATDGTVPVFALLEGGKGSVFGVVQCTGSPATLASTLDWFRPAGLPGTRFTAGWPDGVQLALDGAAWTPFKAKVSWPLPGLAATTGSAHLSASEGRLSPALDWAVTFVLKTDHATVAPTASGATASFTCAAGTGVFSGKIKPSPAAAPLSISGVLMPAANQARGFFLTPTGSGAVGLQVP